jgi:glycosyltransferase involved in cell wall biosynthesis
MNPSELTVIIPFRNEKYEVEETLKSILEHSDGNVEILLINDASDDDFDYKTVAEKYHAGYLVNEERLGVASSRDIGVQACKTPYFLLLDAHMRFYDHFWVDRMVGELKSDPKVFLCSQTKVLVRVNGLLSEVCDRTTSYGAYVKLQDGIRLFELNWITREPQDPELKTVPIPCVLGAGYACGKEYWLYLNGLEGLMQYGNDEAYISIKVWMSGGSCKLLKDLVIGHIYRDQSPYTMDSVYRLYNRLFLSELFLSPKTRKIILS